MSRDVRSARIVLPPKACPPPRPERPSRTEPASPKHGFGSRLISLAWSAETDPAAPTQNICPGIPEVSPIAGPTIRAIMRLGLGAGRMLLPQTAFACALPIDIAALSQTPSLSELPRPDPGLSGKGRGRCRWGASTPPNAAAAAERSWRRSHGEGRFRLCCPTHPPPELAGTAEEPTLLRYDELWLGGASLFLLRRLGETAA